MKFILLLLSTSLLAQEPSQPLNLNPQTTTALVEETKSIMVIDPKSRSSDYIQAFELLRRDKPTLKVMIRMLNGAVLTNITEISATTNGTLFLIKVLSNQGTKYQVLPVEEMAEITYSP